MAEQNGWLREHLRGISKQVSDLDKKFDAFVLETCPARHEVTSKRVDVLELEQANKKYLSKWIVGAVAFISATIGAFGDKIWQWLQIK